MRRRPMTKQKRLPMRLCLNGQRGYILLTLLLFMVALMIAAAAAAPTIARQIQRDREEELIHRGMQYRRAIRRYIRQTGRYPMKFEDLDTGSVRYLRKRYKDPITGAEFKPLHMLDIPQTRTPIPNPSSSSQSGASESGTPDNPAATANAASGQDQTGTSAEQQPQTSEQKSTLPPNPRPQPPSASQTAPTFGGGVIIGVVSTSSKKTIREFNHKNRYNQWLFFYDPAFDRTQDTYGPTPVGRVPNALQSSATSLNAPAQPAAQQ